MNILDMICSILKKIPNLLKIANVIKLYPFSVLKYVFFHKCIINMFSHNPKVLCIKVLGK